MTTLLQNSGQFLQRLLWMLLIPAKLSSVEVAWPCLNVSFNFFALVWHDFQ